MVLTHFVSSHLARSRLPLSHSLEVIFGLGANLVPLRPLFPFLKSLQRFLSSSLEMIHSKGDLARLLLVFT